MKLSTKDKNIILNAIQEYRLGLVDGGDFDYEDGNPNEEECQQLIDDCDDLTNRLK